MYVYHSTTYVYLITIVHVTKQGTLNIFKYLCHKSMYVHIIALFVIKIV